MVEKYDCRGYCMNLQEVNLKEKGKDDFYLNKSISGNPTAYYCSLTNQHCVGAKAGFWISSSDKLELKVIERCPSRQTIDEVLKKE